MIILCASFEMLAILSSAKTLCTSSAWIGYFFPALLPHVPGTGIARSYQKCNCLCNC